MRRWFFWLSILLLCKSMLVGWPAPAQAQVAVFDAANLVQTTVTAIQSVLSVANQVLELTQVGQVVLATGAYAADLEQLATLVCAGGSGALLRSAEPQCADESPP